jgi:hypothetical protein
MTTRLQAQLRVDTQTSWAECNQQWLIAAIARLRERFEAKLADGTPGGVQDCIDVTLDQRVTPALLRCSQVFGLTPFERELLLLTAGLELDQDLRSLVSRLNGGNSPAATFELALGVLTQPHWDALGPDAPLRYWRLIELQEGSPLAHAPLGIDERVLHFITGVAAGEPRLLGIAGAIGAPTRTDGSLTICWQHESQTRWAEPRARPHHSAAGRSARFCGVTRPRAGRGKSQGLLGIVDQRTHSPPIRVRRPRLRAAWTAKQPWKTRFR